MKVEYFKPEAKEAYVQMPSSDKTHIVRPAETYTSIAAQYNLPEEELRTKNNNDILFIGKRLMI